jgi:hypothetical protein
VVSYTDSEGNEKVTSDDHYLLVCSPEYRQNPFKDDLGFDDQYVIIQETFDEEAVQQEVAKRLAQVHVKNWDEYQDAMAELFVTE